jgi:hypothetical protein
MAKSLSVVVVVVLATFLLCTLALAQQASPSADTFVNSSTPGTNYGSGIILVVAPGNNTYMKFNLSDVPTGATVSKATLRLFVDAVVAGGQFDVYNLPSTPTWSESTLTYKTPPPALGTSATGAHPTSVSTSSFNTFVLIDITSTVQGWLSNPSSNNGVALALVGSAGWFSFDSKESFLTAHQPELEIVLTGLAGATGPQGPQGLTGATGPTGVTGGPGQQGLTGATGAIGAIGPTGPMGLVGPQGPAGMNGTNGTGFNFRNAFDPSATYAVNDVITYSGSTYVAIAPNQGPSNSNPDVNPAWALMAQQGAAGPAGAAGGTGPQGMQGPQGPQGPQGAQGPAGPPGSSGLISFNNLNALPCTVGGTAGTIALSFASNGVATLTCNPSVTPTLTSIAITPANPSVAPGNMQQFSSTGTYSDASTQNLTTAATWSSSNTAAATIVANTGLATTVASGTTAISATLGSVSGMTMLQVLAPDGFGHTAVTASSLGTLACNQSEQISGTIFPAGNQDWLTITWSPDGTCQANGFVMVPAINASNSGIVFDLVLNAAETGVPNAFDNTIDIFGIFSGEAAAVRLPNTYYIRIYGVPSSVTGSWTMSLTTQALPQ